MPTAITLDNLQAGPAAAASNTATIQQAMAAYPHVQIPSGDFYVNKIIAPASLKNLSGEGTSTRLLAGPGVSPGDCILLMDGMTGFVIRDLAVLDLTAVPAIDAINALNVYAGTFDNIELRGYMGMSIATGQDIKIRGCKVDDFAFRGLMLLACCQSQVQDCFVDGSGGHSTNHGVCVQGGYMNKVVENTILVAAQSGFGISGYATNSLMIAHNIVEAGFIEAINVDGTCNFIISSNLCSYQPGHHDFGISVFGDATDPISKTCLSGVISGNRVIGSGISGIALCGAVSDVLVTGNSIENPGQCRAYPAQSQDWGDNAGVLLYGDLCTSNTVQGNHVNSYDGFMSHGVAEGSRYGGMPHDNFVGQNALAGYTAGALSLTASTGQRSGLT